jgi:flagellar motor switch protein FliM
MADEEAMMAEWESMAEEGDSGAEGAAEAEAEGDAGAAGGGGGGSTRVLDQSEIDSLLGVAGAGAEDGEESGIQAILNSALVSYERLPMLEVVFDLLVPM